MQDARNFKQCKERVPRTKFTLEPGTVNGPDQKHEKDDRVIKTNEDKLCDREGYVEDQEVSLKTKKEQLVNREHWKRKENEIEPERPGWDEQYRI